MFLFWRKKDDDETAGRKAILEHLKNLEKQNLIHWTPKEGHTIYKGRTYTVNGQSHAYPHVDIELTYLKLWRNPKIQYI